MLTVQHALEKILADPALEKFSLHTTDMLPLLQSMGRVLAENQIANIDVPAWDNSAMDGYALCTTDLLTRNSLPVSQIIPAGKFPSPLLAGTAARIFTGAPIPAGADSVEMQENTSTENENIVFLQSIKTGANIRRRGEDITKGSLVVAAGSVLNPSHLGLLASVGIASLPVQKILRVAVLSTGDELAEPGSPLNDGQIYNSNRYLLISLLHQLGCEVIDGGMVGDDLATTQQRLSELVQHSDIIISSGGVSVGDEDHVKKAVEAIGQLDLWKISVKPGKPLAFGHIKETTFFGLPGNPVSAFVTFLLFVKPYLLKAQGAIHIHPLLIEAVADFDWPPLNSAQEKNSAKERKSLKREEYLRARLKEDGKSVEIYPNQSSGALSSVVWANGLVMAPQGSVINRGDKIKFLFVK